MRIILTCREAKQSFMVEVISFSLISLSKGCDLVFYRFGINTSYHVPCSYFWSDVDCGTFSAEIDDIEDYTEIYDKLISEI